MTEAGPGFVDRLHRRVIGIIWPPGRAGSYGPVLGTLQVVYMLVRDFIRGGFTLRATSLVYTTLLSLVPLLAVSFSVLKAFGVHKRIEPLMLELAEPLGPKGAELTETVIGFVDNLNVAVLGVVGFAMLFYTAVSLIHKVEKAFNEIWEVAKSRPFLQRIGQYLSLILVGPVVIVTAMGLTASAMSTSVMQALAAVEPFGTLIETLARITPYLLVVVAFTLIYRFLPNTRVAMASAIVGGIVAGVLWAAGGALFATFVAGSTKYTTLYAGFAIAIVFMIWVYYCWLILLTGASIAFYHQHPESRVPDDRERLSVRAVEELALRVAAEIARCFRTGQPAPDIAGLARSLNVSGNRTDSVASALLEAGLVRATEDGGLLPARALERIPVADVLDAVYTRGASGVAWPADPAIESVMDALTDASRRGVDRWTLAELAGDDAGIRGEAAAPPGSASAL